MKEAVVTKGTHVEIIDSPIPTPQPGQVVIKVVFSGSNPKDWKYSLWHPELPPINQGDDIAGTVHAVGEGVIEFKVGDRVAAFHEMLTKGGSYAEYAVAWAHTTFHLPAKTSFEAGAALPLAAFTAAVGLYASDRLSLPQPWSPATSSISLVVYGAASAVGSYVLQLAAKSNIHPLICIAGRAQDHVEKLIDRSKGDTIIDYRKGDEAIVQGIRDALKGQKLQYAYDAVSENGSCLNLGKVIDAQTGRITTVLPSSRGMGEPFEGVPEGVKQSLTRVGDTHGQNKELGLVFARYFTRGLDEGWFRAQPQELVPGGLTGISTALSNLKDGKASAVKYIFKIADTPGVGSSS